MIRQLFAAAVLLVATASHAQTRAFVGATIIPIGAPVIEDGVLVVTADGKISAVGPRASTSVPAGAEQIDARGRVIMPGLVDTHSHIGQVAGADASAPIQPDVRAVDSINVRDARIARARAGGITSVNVMPGSGHLLSGQTLYMKLRRGATVDDLAYRNGDGSYAGGIKMANGTNSMRDSASFPGTRSKSAALVREQFLKAQDYRKKRDAAKKDPEKAPTRDLAMDALVEVLEGKRTVHFHTHRHDDVITAIRIGKEFGFTPVLHHVSEAWKVAKEIAAAGAPASIIVIDSPGGKLEAMDVSMENGAVLDAAGALVAFHTDDGVTDSRFFLRSAALGVRSGMNRERALEAMTINGAKMLGLANRVGSLARGKDADFIVLSGDPLSTYTRVLQTWIDGRKVFDFADATDRLYAVGGYGASDEQPVTPGKEN